MRNRPIKSLLTRLAIGLALCLALLVALYTWRTIDLALDLRATANQLQALALDDPASLDFSEVAPLVTHARLTAGTLDRQIQPLAWLTRLLRWLPFYGPAIGAAPSLTSYAASLTVAADELLQGLSPLLGGSQAEGGDAQPFSVRILATLVEAQPRLETSRQAVEAAITARRRFDLAALPSSLQGPLAKLDPVLPQLQQGLRVLTAMPPLMGLEEAQSYLLVAQNRDELRATGGFITAVGTAVLDRGRLASLSIGDSYDVDDLTKTYPLPPEPLQRYMLAQQWLVRDANWSPDFPTSAHTLRQLYEFSTGVHVTGVIAFNQEAIVRLLEVTGPVTVAGAPEPIDSANVEAYMHQAWAPEPNEGFSQEWWEHRKDFMGDLGAALVAQIQSSPDRSRLLVLAKAVAGLVKEKHLLLCIEDQVLSGVLSQLAWDASLRPGRGDFLMLVDSNVGFNKVDARVERSIEYAVDFTDPARPLASLTVSYENVNDPRVVCEHIATYGEGTYDDMQKRCYWDYVRVFVPDGSQYQGGSLPFTPREWLLSREDETGTWQQGEGEAGTAVFSGIFVLPAGTDTELTLTYLLPAGMLTMDEDGTCSYSLRIAKQPGIGAVPYSVTVRPPQAYQPVAATGWTSLADGRLFWEGNLKTDVLLTLRLSPVSP